MLIPAEVDEATGYRRYSVDQVRRAQAIRGLRFAHVPLGEVVALVETDDAEMIRKVVTEHRDRLVERVGELSVAIERVDRMIETGRVMPPVTGKTGTACCSTPSA